MIAAIFSIDQVGGMGTNGTLPWSHHPEDMKWFREITEGQVVIMGRKTWDDPKMPNPLPNRANYVVTHRPRDINSFTLGEDWLSKLSELQRIHSKQNIFIIGGVGLLEASRPLIDFAYVTHRKGNYRCETRMNMSDYVMGLRAISARPSTDKMLNFTVYKNIESEIPLHEGLY